MSFNVNILSSFPLCLDRLGYVFCEVNVGIFFFFNSIEVEEELSSRKIIFFSPAQRFWKIKERKHEAFFWKPLYNSFFATVSIFQLLLEWSHFSPPPPQQKFQSLHFFTPCFFFFWLFLKLFIFLRRKRYFYSDINFYFL